MLIHCRIKLFKVTIFILRCVPCYIIKIRVLTFFVKTQEIVDERHGKEKKTKQGFWLVTNSQKHYIKLTKRSTQKTQTNTRGSMRAKDGVRMRVCTQRDEGKREREGEEGGLTHSGVHQTPGRINLPLLNKKMHQSAVGLSLLL